MVSPSGPASVSERLRAVLEPTLGPLEVENLRQLSGGTSRETWSFTAGGRPLILRRDPPGRPGLPGSMRLEADAMRACRRAGLAVPEVLVDDDGEVLGAAGLVMAHVEGETLARKILRDEQYTRARERLVDDLGRFLAGLHAIDPGEVPGAVDTDSLEQYWKAYQLIDDTSPTIDKAYAWLDAHRPARTATTIVHGDLRLGNLIVDDNGLAAAIDWELVHIGDPLEDLGWLCVKAWRFGAPLEVGGIGTIDQLIATYEGAGGRTVDRDAMHWWLVAKTLQWGVGCMSQAAVHLSGAVRSHELAAIGRHVAEQEWDLIELLAPDAWNAAAAAPLPTPLPDVASIYGRPTARELLDAVRRYLTDDVMPATTGRMSFHARVAANMLAIVERELAQPPADYGGDELGRARRHGADEARRREPEAPAKLTGARRTGQPLGFARMADVGAGDLFAIDVVDIRGVPTKVFRHAPPSLRVVWEMSAGYAANEYLVYDDERVTYADAHREARRVAGWLRAQGVRQGDRVALATRNLPEWVVAFWAAQAIGAVTVPLNAWWTGAELAYGLADSGSAALFVDDERAQRIAPHLGDTNVRSIALIRSDGTLPGGQQWAEIVAGDDVPLPDLQVDLDADAAIMYTSGTTGKPKGAVQTQRNFTNFLMQGVYLTMQMAGTSGAPASAPTQLATLLTLPLFHVGGLQSFLLPFTAAGGKLVLTYRWDAAEAVDIIEREGITSIAGVPTTMFELLDAARAKGATIESLSGISSGATLVPPELVRRIDEQTSSRAAPGNGYGLTETSGAAIANFGPTYVANPESVGKPISPVIDVQVVAGDGRVASVGEIGEIWLKGPTIVRGYLGRELETAEAFTDGWFHTGDLGRLDEERNLYVVDRLKDVIIRGGENVYAAEIEAALYEHPDMTEAAVVGVPDERLGEAVGAVVRVRSGATLTEDDVRAHVAARLAAFKVPAHVWITDSELPRNASGKVLKRELRDRLVESS